MRDVDVTGGTGVQRGMRDEDATGGTGHQGATRDVDVTGGTGDQDATMDTDVTGATGYQGAGMIAAQVYPAATPMLTAWATPAGDTSHFMVHANGRNSGHALEVAGARQADKPLTETDARAIQSAEARATGGNTRGGLADMAQAVVDTPGIGGEDVKVVDVLADATRVLSDDKPVTPEDAYIVESVEIRNSATGEVVEGGIAATLHQAAAVNRSAGFV
ncbi:hypothetical protein R1sor_012224 [Riccia sorocarpa]|uniref:SMP domain-containing protein n=1 Tax=Riccia sorocarpa TaxID=122646 RepID=A0ABD3I363_9MARC